MSKFKRKINEWIRSKVITRQGAKLLESSGSPIQNDIDSFPQHRQSERLSHSRRPISRRQNMLDTNMFEYYSENLWSMLSVENRISYTYLDCLWFSLYKEGSAKTKVLEWIKKKQIFLRKYVFVPIVCWGHWSLLILCHLGENGKLGSKRPCMLLLDSLQELDPKRLEPDIRRFVHDIYRSEGREEKNEFIYDIPLLIPKVPQQKNGEDCGIFVLYFLHLFLESAPESFTLEGYPYFLNEEWFKLEDLESFREELDSIAKCEDVIHVL